MKQEDRRAGVWVDHEKAWITFVEAGAAGIEEIASNVDPHFRAHGGSRTRVPYGPQEKSSESRIEGHRKKQLHEYYGEICARLKGATEILILGPEQARRELLEELNRQTELRGRASTKASDRVTRAQFTAAVKGHFGIAPRRKPGAIRG
jgi:hypothetical protein